MPVELAQSGGRLTNFRPQYGWADATGPVGREVDDSVHLGPDTMEGDSTQMARRSLVIVRPSSTKVGVDSGMSQT
jgi:hypothetical protein